jgi:peroxiredoxin
MKSPKFVALVLLLTVKLFAAEGDIVAVGQKAPLFSGVATDGTTVTSESLSGKVILLDFFATWCGPCMAEMPHIEKDIWATNKSPDLKVIAVGREHTVEELKKWQASSPVTFTLVADPKREIYKKYATQYIPRCYVIGKDGLIKYTSIGFNEEEFEKMKAVIASELKR